MTSAEKPDFIVDDGGNVKSEGAELTPLDVNQRHEKLVELGEATPEEAARMAKEQIDAIKSRAIPRKEDGKTNPWAKYK